MKGPLRSVTDFGTRFARSQSEKRNIILSNYAAVIGCAAIWLLTAALIIVYGFKPGVVLRIGVASLFFVVPLIANRLGFVVLSRVLLCAVIPLAVFGVSILDLKSGEVMTSSSFAGLRLFLLVALCFPFLLFDLTQRWLLALGLSFPFMAILFFDAVFALFGVGYLTDPVRDRFYEFNNVRAVISASAIGACLFLLKLMAEYAERKNHVLMLRLEEQNKIIKRQAEVEVYKLNEELESNVERLSEREFMLNQSQRVAKLGSWEYNAENAFTFWSDEMYNITGLDKDVSLKARGLFGSLIGDSAEDFYQSASRLLKTGRPFDSVVSLVTPQQRSKWVRICGFPVFKNERIVGVRGICHDITAYKEAEEKLRASEYQYRSLFEQASDAIAVFGFDGKFHDVNMSWCKTFGYSKEEMLTLKVEDVIDPEELELAPVLYESIRDGEQVNDTRRMRRKDGEILEIENHMQIFRNDRILTISRDVTKLRRAQKQIALNEANLRATINNTDVLIWALDREFRLIMFNKRFAKHVVKYYGVEPVIGEIPRPTFDTPETLDLREEWLSRLTRALKGERFRIEEHRFGIDLEYSLNPIVEGTEVIGVSIFADDVTDRKLHELQLNEANRKINELRLMALRSVMSPHFIFNVLNSIQYFIVRNDRLNAINYLSSFSKLVRNILSHSVENSVSLVDEIEMLRSYVQLELVRFENKFSFSMEVNPRIDTEAIVIPSLLIQPYVENAILHGLYNKESAGHLSIRIDEDEAQEMLVFEIEDNGIGRAAATELRKRNILPHRPMGINITEERLKLINQGHRAAFEVEDLMDNDGQAAGTRVRIRVSYAES